MEQYKFIIIVICSLVQLVSCVARRKRNETTKTFNTINGEATAVDYLIQKYEKEHQKFYGEETQNGSYLWWPALNDKNISNYCSKYLQHSVPMRKSDNTTGTEIRTSLSYGKQILNITSLIIAIHCKVLKKNYKLSYFVTRAPEPNCVYSLKRLHNTRESVFTIINKYCNFEDKPLINKLLKRKRVEITSQLNCKTGQPIAKDEYLLQYELDHQNMLKKEGKGGKCTEWTQAMTHPNLDYYCYQYLGECAPDRNREGVTGSRKIGELRYQKWGNIFKYVEVIIITCVLAKSTILRYHMTKAPESSCVYALLLRGYNSRIQGKTHFVIIFKHCDFDNPYGQPATSCNHDIPDENVVPKMEMKGEPSEVKEEHLDTLETSQLFS